LIPLIVFFAIGTGILLSKNVCPTEFTKDRQLVSERKSFNYLTVSFKKVQSKLKFFVNLLP